jgi:hypothetical protein
MRLFTASLLLLAAAGCGRHKRDVEEPRAAPVAGAGEDEAEPVPQDPREDPEARGTERELDPPDSTMQQCAAYEACCLAYISAMAPVASMTPDAVETALEGCKAIGTLVGTPEAEETCKQAREAMKQAVDAMNTVPGFVPPAACQ